VKMEVSFLIEEGLICEMANLAALFLNWSILLTIVA
jgi:hypothetical protein